MLRNRRFYMSAHVLLNLQVGEKEIKWEACLEIEDFT